MPYSRDVEQVKATVAATMDDNDVVVISLDAGYLRFALDGATGTVALGLSGRDKPMTVEANGYRHLIMPLAST
jgi:hypothetical protein